VNGGVLTKGTRGVNVINTSQVEVQGVRAYDQDDYGIVANDTAVVTSRKNTITGASLLAQEFKAAGATLVSDVFQDWTPVFASDIGNAAATFAAGVVTIFVARYSRDGNLTTVIVYYGTTLNAVTPNYIELTLPPGVVPLSSNQRIACDILNNVTREVGIARTVTVGNVIRVYRSGAGAGPNYTAAAAVEGAFSFTFEST
jgi:hypothetical protein